MPARSSGRPSIALMLLAGILAAPLDLPSASAQPRTEAAATSQATHYRSVEIDGLKIFYREAGAPDAPVVLLLHGFPASSFMYRDLITRLAPHYRVIAPDYPGFGHSDAPSAEAFAYTFDSLADVIGKFTGKLGLERYALYMQDFGGPVGFRLADRHPEKVTHLIVQNANAYEEGLPDSFWAPVRDFWNEPTPEKFEAIRGAAMSEEALQWNYVHGVKDATRISPDSWLLQQTLLGRPGNKDAMLKLLYDYRTNPAQYARWQGTFRKHQFPTLIAWGQNDAIFPAPGARAFLKDLPKAELHLLDTGHFALEEKSGEIADLMIDFLHRHPATGRRGD
jgi:pimeloyl-ACP methyl ester carboxylesterase